MRKITLTIKDDKKLGFLIELLQQFDFIEISNGEKKQDNDYNFFASAGLWKNRDINSEELRNRAWKRNH